MTGILTWDYNGGGFFCDGRSIELVDGHLDSDAVDVFTRGHCHSLALALHELTGAELVAVWNGDTLPDHVLVEVSDGVFLDAAGRHDEDGLRAQWYGEISLQPTDEAEIEHWERGDWGYRTNRREDALPFARALCEREGIEIRELAAA